MRTILKIFLLFFCVSSYAQTTIKGTVTDDSGQPLPGANIIIVGTSTGTMTDFDGKYTLNTSQLPPFTIQVSSVGFETQTKEATSNNQVIDFALKEGSELDEIVIFPNYNSGVSSVDSTERQPIGGGLSIVETDHYISHKLLKRLILSKTGFWYNKSNDAKTISRLLDIGLFRFVNIVNEVHDTDSVPSVRQMLLLTPEPLQSISGEVELNNRSGNFFGTGASASYIHRNLFGSAERLRFTVAGQLESQIGDGISFINSTDVNSELENTPELLNSDPYGSWIIKIEILDEKELDSLLKDSEYKEED
mgnify:CR=1 FL=1